MIVDENINCKSAFMDKIINLAVLLCDQNLPELEVGKQTLPILWSNFFEGTVVSIKTFRIFDNEWPEDGLFENYLITGSRYSVLDDKDWMLKLGEFIRKGDYHKLIAICFGHQMVAHSLGGKVVAGDWHIGVRDVLSDNNISKNARYNHQDHVVVLPQGAVQSYTSEHCKIAGYSIGNKILSYQFHPEFTERYHKLLHEAKRANLTQLEYLDGIKHLDDPCDHSYFKRQIIDFLEG